MQIRKEKLDSLTKKWRKRKYISILLALFTLGVNIFAWFAFSANAGLELDATVASWDVEFKDENDQIITRDIVIEITKMKPGMSDYNKTIEIESNSDVNANFSYIVTSLSILGTTVDLTNKGNALNYIRDFYPFSITASSDKTVLTGNDTVTFEINVVWPYDITPITYFGQDEVYNYENTFTYYTLANDTYSPATVANATSYNSQKSSLYVEKDDADTYFGMRCKEYETTSGEACLVLNMRLIVEQSNT